MVFKFNQPKPSEITPPAVWKSRRHFIQQLTATGVVGLLPLIGSRAGNDCELAQPASLNKTDTLTPLKSVTRYNNYYEFSNNKEVIHLLAQEFNPRPWTLQVDGEVEQPLTLELDERALTLANGRAHLPHALCRGLVDADPTGTASHSAIC